MAQLRTGVPMQMHVIKTRFEAGCRPGPKSPELDDRLAEVRRLLRSDESIPVIAQQLGVSTAALRNFIKRRRLCDVAARKNFITLQKTIAGEPIE